MLQLLLTSLLLSVPSAHADSAAVLPEGSKVVYAGLGVSTFRHLSYGDGTTTNGAGEIVQDGRLDRLVKPRLDLYASMGIKPWLQLSAWAPVVASFALTDDSTGPCPDQGPEGFCDDIVTVGEAGLQARFGLQRERFKFTPALALTSDIWNLGTRGQYNAVGEATIALVPGLYLGYDQPLGDWRLGLHGWGNYAWNVVRRQIDFGSAAPFGAPADELSEGAALSLRMPIGLTVAGLVEAVQRRWGVDWEGSYYQEYWIGNDDRWAVLKYEDVVLRGKLSVELGDDMGLHAQAGRIVYVRNGPPDTWDFGLGWHKYFAP